MRQSDYTKLKKKLDTEISHDYYCPLTVDFNLEEYSKFSNHITIAVSIDNNFIGYHRIDEVPSDDVSKIKKLIKSAYKAGQNDIRNQHKKLMGIK